MTFGSRLSPHVVWDDVSPPPVCQRVEPHMPFFQVVIMIFLMRGCFAWFPLSRKSALRPMEGSPDSLVAVEADEGDDNLKKIENAAKMQTQNWWQKHKTDHLAADIEYYPEDTVETKPELERKVNTWPTKHISYIAYIISMLQLQLVAQLKIIHSCWFKVQGFFLWQR